MLVPWSQNGVFRGNAKGKTMLALKHCQIVTSQFLRVPDLLFTRVIRVPVPTEILYNYPYFMCGNWN